MPNEVANPPLPEVAERPPVRRKRPKTVTYLAYVFVGLGLISALEMFFELADPNVPIPAMNFLVAFIPLGIGLWFGKEIARVVAINCAAFVGVYYLLVIVLHFMIGRGRALQLHLTVIFWVMSVGALVASIYAIFCLSRRSSLTFFSKGDDDDDF
jgi:hypothetical protein